MGEGEGNSSHRQQYNRRNHMSVDDNQRNVRNSIIDLMLNLSVEVEGTPGHVRTGARTRTESEGEGESGTQTSEHKLVLEVFDGDRLTLDYFLGRVELPLVS